MDDAVLMFGGVNADLSSPDVGRLLRFMAAYGGTGDSAPLAALVDETVPAPVSSPAQEGHELALDLLDELGVEADAFIDVHAILKRLDIEVRKQRLDSATIRGVALAGDGFRAAVLVNTRSSYNKHAAGQRFTLAHELFHILYDRSRARTVAHTSGPWAPRAVEQRANAFAAMLLAPEPAVRRLMPAEPTAENVAQVAAELRVGTRHLIEHLHNLHLIDDHARADLRARSKTRRS